MAGETNIEDYDGPDRPHDSVIEPVFGGPLKAGYSRKRWLDADGSAYKGYRHPNGQLVGVCTAVSPARQAILDVINAATTAENNNRTQFFARCEVLFGLARTRALDTGRPAEERQMWEAIARLLRGLKGVYEIVS